MGQKNGYNENMSKFAEKRVIMGHAVSGGLAVRCRMIR